MCQTEDKQRIAFMDLEEPWHLLGRAASGHGRQTYYQYGTGRQHALIVLLHGLRRNQVLHRHVRLRIEDEELGLPVVHILGVVEESEVPQSGVYLVSAVIRAVYARRGGSRRGRPYRKTSRGQGGGGGSVK